MPSLSVRLGMWALRTNVHIWACPFTEWLDATLQSQGVPLVDLPWSAFDVLEEDTLHFTRTGYIRFAKALAETVRALHVGSTLHILSDSTIDYWNWDDDGTYTGWASHYLESLLRPHVPHARVDAIVGSGFLASDSSFRRRIGPPGTPTLIIGGWNDQAYARAAVERAVATLVRRLRPHSLNVSLQSRFRENKM